MLSLLTVYSLILCFFRKAYSVPPDACFAKFRWQDCGQPPTPVMYYWKSGSRCEVGLWRGCLPNPNMFKDEYECVATCIFASRARSEDFHNYNEVIPMTDIIETESTTLDGNQTTDGNTTESGSNGTEVTTVNGETGATGGNDETGATGATGADGAEGGETTAGEGEAGEATTAGEAAEGGDEAAATEAAAEDGAPADDAPPPEEPAAEK